MSTTAKLQHLPASSMDYISTNLTDRDHLVLFFFSKLRLAETYIDHTIIREELQIILQMSETSLKAFQEDSNNYLQLMDSCDFFLFPLPFRGLQQRMPHPSYAYGPSG